MDIQIFDQHTGEDNTYTKAVIADFLHEHLDEFGDKREDILNAIHYAFASKPGQDGYVVIGLEEDEIVGAVIMNETGMRGYIPENILVYIAVDRKMRGKGAGKQLMTAAINRAKGNIALHVEPNNPAKFLYEKLGFTNKYLEMRLNRS